jgi:ABC-type glycerol-3-phosphate transport system permease component
MSSSSLHSAKTAEDTARLDLSRIYTEPVDWRYKGFPPVDDGVTIGTVGNQDWNALEGDLIFPIMLIKERALDGNIALMARYCQEHDVSLAPHAKTPVAPQIVERQLAAGAWGVTVATVQQARVLRAHGAARILVANELLQSPGLRWLMAELQDDPEFEAFVSVDSVAAVAAMRTALEGLDVRRRLAVLVELGIRGGRTGARSRDEALAVAYAVQESAMLHVAGVTGYEGAAGGATHEARSALVDEFLGEVRRLTGELDRRGLFLGNVEVVVSAGGSIFFDHVVAQLGSQWDLSQPVRLVLRSGSYVTQDSDTYDLLSPLGIRNTSGESLQPALELWSTVLSLILGVPAAYAMSRFSMGKSAMVVLMARIIPGVSLLVPWYFIFANMRLVGGFGVLILSHMFVALPLIVYIMMSFFDSMTTELEDAAQVDGLTAIGAFMRITLPLSAPGLATAGILSFIFSWNNFMFALVLAGANTKTLPVAIFNFVSYASIDWGGLMSASVVVTVPIMVIALFTQKYIVAGLTAGATKG